MLMDLLKYLLLESILLDFVLELIYQIVKTFAIIIERGTFAGIPRIIAVLGYSAEQSFNSQKLIKKGVENANSKQKLLLFLLQ